MLELIIHPAGVFYHPGHEVCSRPDQSEHYECLTQFISPAGAQDWIISELETMETVEQLIKPSWRNAPGVFFPWKARVGGLLVLADSVVSI